VNILKAEYLNIGSDVQNMTGEDNVEIKALQHISTLAPFSQTHQNAKKKC
jgi:hypothetical protein